MGSLTSRDLFTVLWASADVLRQTMTADVYKDYLLCLVFYKSLSDKQLYTVMDLIENREPKDLNEAQSIYEEFSKNADDFNDLKEELIARYGVVISPEYSFTNLYQKVNKGTFMLEDLNQAFRNIERGQGHFYEGLFDGFDTSSKDLGPTAEKRNKTLSSVISSLEHINFNEYVEDALGDAYEYLIAQFASESGKKAGEFYTPKSVSTLISKIVTYGKEKKIGFSVYDPCMGSGSLLLQVKERMYRDDNDDFTKYVRIFGQDKINQTYNLARMNMILHHVPVSNQSLRNADTLDADWPTDEPTTFDATVMNPPYSANYPASQSLLSDPRFALYEAVPPKDYADYAFLLHGFYHLKDDGVMGIVLPHGVLFRGKSEGIIRKHLVENGSIYAVIGLPENIFYNTGIPTCILVLKKNNTERNVLFIDASKEFEKQGKRNVLTENNINKIFQTYINRKEVSKFAYLATIEEIKNNEYNLNIPRYVDTFEEEELIDINSLVQEYNNLIKEEEKVDNNLNNMLKELGLNFKIGE